MGDPSPDDDVTFPLPNAGLSPELQRELIELARTFREERGRKLSRTQQVGAAAWKVVNSAFVVAAVGSVGLGYLLNQYAAGRDDEARKARDAEAKQEATRRQAEARHDAKLRLYERLVTLHTASNSYATLYCTNSILFGSARRLARMSGGSASKATYLGAAAEYDKTRSTAWDKWTDAGATELVAMQAADLFKGTSTGVAASSLSEYWSKQEDSLFVHLTKFKADVEKCDSSEAVTRVSDAGVEECNAQHIRADKLLREMATGAYSELFPPG